MQDAPAHVDKTIEDLKRQVTSKMDEVKNLVAAINTLERMIGLAESALTRLPALPGPDTTRNAVTGSSGGELRRIGAMLAIRPDQYLGVPPLDAAKQFIGSVGHAVHIDEIADALVRGGAAVVGSDWKENLERSLIRSTFEVVKVQEKTFGLVGFYTEEQLKGLRATRRQADPKKPAAARKPKRRSSTTRKRLIQGEAAATVVVAAKDEAASE